MFQPATTDCSPDGLRRARNNLRLMLWANNAFAHMWLVHYPHNETSCPDGCAHAVDSERAEFYQSEIEEG